MLVFTRCEGERIIIGDDIEIEVVRISHDRVRIGIVAPPNVDVHRREVYEKIQKGSNGSGDV